MKVKYLLKRGHILYFIYYWIYEQVMDRVIGGRVLNSMLENKEFCGGVKDNEFHPVQSTSYRLLALAIKSIKVDENDVFVDVGCGYGRVISYMMLKKKKCRYIGIDINEKATSLAKRRFRRFDNVTIIRDNIVNYIPPESTIFYLFNPFGIEVLNQFLDKLENTISTDITLYYLNPVHEKAFNSRKRWTLVNKKKITPKYHLPIEMNIYKYSY